MTTISDRAVQAAKAVLAKCSANDPWFPQPSESTVLAWAEHIAIANIDTDDLLAAVTAVYREHGSGFKPLPADIITAARAIRQERFQRTPIDERSEHQRRIDSKAADELMARVTKLAESKAVPPDEDFKFKRPECNPLMVACQHCKAPMFRHCVDTRGRPLAYKPHYHPSRIEAAEKAKANL